MTAIQAIETEMKSIHRTPAETVYLSRIKRQMREGGINKERLKSILISLGYIPVGLGKWIKKIK